MRLPTDQNEIHTLISEINICEKSINTEVANNYWRSCRTLDTKDIMAGLLAMTMITGGAAGFGVMLKMTTSSKADSKDEHGDAIAAGFAISIVPILLSFLCIGYLLTRSFTRFPVSTLVISQDETLGLINRLQSYGELTTVDLDITPIEKLQQELERVREILVTALELQQHQEKVKRNEEGRYVHAKVLIDREAVQKLSWFRPDTGAYIPRESIVLDEIKEAEECKVERSTTDNFLLPVYKN